MQALTIRLEPDQLQELAALIVAEQSKRAGDKPLTVRQAAERTGWSEDTIRRRIDAKLIKTLPGHKKLIPAAEITKLTHPD